MLGEIIFLVEENTAGQLIAHSLDQRFTVHAETWDDLKQQTQALVADNFGKEQLPILALFYTAEEQVLVA